MRILYHHRIRSKDGQHVHVAELIAALRRLGHAVRLVEPGGTRSAAFGDDGGGVARLKTILPRALYELLELGYGVLATLRLLGAAGRFRPDLIYERYNLHLPAGAIVARLLGVPLLLEVNAPLAEERDRFGGLGLPGLARRVERWIWRGADRVLVVSGPLAERVAAVGAAPERIVVVPNGINPDDFATLLPAGEAKRRLGMEADRLVLGFVGFVREWHGLDRVLDWLARSGRPEMVLLLVGDGPARPGLQAQAERLGIGDRLRCTGLVERTAIPEHLAAFDIALQPAVVEYASPLKLFEYMAAGLAIVAPDRPNIREILTHEVDGLLCPPDQVPAALARLTDQPALRRQLGAAARESVLRRGLTWDANARRVEQLATACIAERKATARKGLADQTVELG